jgi:glycosyltransferase involved in cell wall biosynthesis
MNEVLYDSRWIGNHGIGRFASELQSRLPRVVPFRAQRPPWHPFVPALLGLTLRRLNPKLYFSPGYNSPLGWHGSFVFTLHDLHHLRVPENSNVLKRAYYNHVIKPACRKSPVVLTVSEYSRREIAEWANLSEELIVNVGNGVGPPFGAEGAVYEPGYPYLLYVGSRKPHKNLPRLLLAYCRSGVQKDARLVIAGRPDNDTLREVHRVGIDAVFTQFDSNESLARAYRGAIALLFPSLYEGFGLPPLEAMACGTPVLASNVCALPEVLGDAAILVDPGDSEAITEGIRRIVGDASLRAQLRTKGLIRSKLFSWSETARKTARIFEMILGKPQGTEPWRASAA